MVIVIESIIIIALIIAMIKILYDDKEDYERVKESLKGKHLELKKFKTLYYDVVGQQTEMYFKKLRNVNKKLKYQGLSVKESFDRGPSTHRKFNIIYKKKYLCSMYLTEEFIITEDINTICKVVRKFRDYWTKKNAETGKEN